MSQANEEPRKLLTENDSRNSEIAIVDDDSGFSFMLKDYLLSIAKLKSDLYSNGNEFLKHYSSNDSRKIILDYEFKEGPNGLIILQKIKVINPLAIVIIVSGQDDLEKAVETLRFGATDYFIKNNKTVFVNIHCSLMKVNEMEKNRWN